MWCKTLSIPVREEQGKIREVIGNFIATEFNLGEIIQFQVTYPGLWLNCKTNLLYFFWQFWWPPGSNICKWDTRSEHHLWWSGLVGFRSVVTSSALWKFLIWNSEIFQYLGSFLPNYGENGLNSSWNGCYVVQLAEMRNRLCQVLVV